MSIGRKNTSMEAGGSGRNREMKEIKGTGQVRLSQAVRQELIDDIYQRADIEACGVLLGTLINGNWQITQAHPLRNIAHSAVYFEFAPDDLLIMELTYPEQIIGVYHSHPTGYPQASSTDRENMQRVNMEQKIPWVWLIVCGPFRAGVEPEERERLLKQQIVAYHHYTETGLQEIALYFEQ